MNAGVIVVVSDRPDRSQPLVDAVRSVAECRVVGTDETWNQTGPLRGVIADITLSRPEAKRCLRLLSGRPGRARTPLICLTRGSGESTFTEARNLGATLCLSALAEPRLVVGSLVREVWPDKSVADLVVTREAQRAGSLMTNLFTSAQTGAIDMPSVERGVDPVLGAIQEGGLSRWLDEVWAHDDVTFQHCLLVSGVAAAFAQKLGLSAADKQLMTRAALVHDVGKSRIPHAVLNKPGRLDDDERAVMQTHAPIGHEILSASGGCDPVTLAVTRYHHEMLDGSGYPDGLSADEIADPVRLLTICDIYAALIERRPYKSPMSSREALSILSGMEGKLEGGLVQAFGRAVQDVA
ncbi:metal dependent phosphohydrolase [Methylorubrum populi BJ001]|jgi:putative nucleotidyltransferase with HDIG domain|uniref:Metal dependent phosphohydrolase n=1 Tax=Methylorubrum populi (strain ATCC BAA-705 / NCIMB 13946 / BJ001) TaxID=441620 RepID=B1ZAL3_METPB|nr:HD domain-containing phosphohydrolase [Methylorubrum populi]ACB82069.1 metal dependent phosphohydrolase [Methylorubrum populi BJ001]OAH22801.1 phosphohydrolase [Methylorubrum populi]PZP69121.1 MAG: HD domain-containing protein [Methylorubrum populi]